MKQHELQIQNMKIFPNPMWDEQKSGHQHEVTPKGSPHTSSLYWCSLPAFFRVTKLKQKKQGMESMQLKPDQMVKMARLYTFAHLVGSTLNLSLAGNQSKTVQTMGPVLLCNLVSCYSMNQVVQLLAQVRYKTRDRPIYFFFLIDN